MFYWNQRNFEGLKSVGEKYSSVGGYECFGNYCLQKEKGLKKFATASIKEFIAQTNRKSILEQRKIAEELSCLAFFNQDIHQLLPHPLTEFLKKVFERWVIDHPNNSIPHKWLGYISGDLSSYERALEIDPKDTICLNRIAQAHLNDVDYQTHHLSESLFIGDFIEAKSSLNKARILISNLDSPEFKLEMHKELTYYENLLAFWQEYSALDREEPFPKWCSLKGEKFDFWSTVYYDQ